MHTHATTSSSPVSKKDEAVNENVFEKQKKNIIQRKWRSLIDGVEERNMRK